MRSRLWIAIELASLTCRFVDSDRILCETRMTNCSANSRPLEMYTKRNQVVGTKLKKKLVTNKKEPFLYDDYKHPSPFNYFENFQD